MKAVLPSAFAGASSIGVGAATFMLLIAVAGTEAKADPTKAGNDDKPESKKT